MITELRRSSIKYLFKFISLKLACNWGIFNTLIGLFIALIYIKVFPHKNKLQTFQTKFNYKVLLLQINTNTSFGLSLGQVIIISADLAKDHIIIQHEIGHTEQSRILGPLYLLFIGIPSLLRAFWFGLLYKYWPKLIKSEYEYFHFYTEAWADQLGDIYNLHNHPKKNWWQYFFLFIKKIS